MKTLCIMVASVLGLQAIWADVDRAQPPPAGPAPVATFPDFKQTALSNGLKIFLIENHRAPTVTFRLMIKAGDALEGDKAGLGDALADQLTKGTQTRTAAQFAAQSDFIGAAIEGSSAPDFLSVSASGLIRDLPQILDLFSDAALRPSFPAEELEKYRRQAISTLVAERQRPSALAAKLTGRLLYGANPYGTYATPESVGRLSREDFAAFHARWFEPANATLAVVGDFHEGDLVPQLEKAFGGWKDLPDAPSRPKTAPLPPTPTGLSIHLIDRPGSVQSDIVVAMRGVARNNPSVPELGLMNSILGGGFSGRLFQNLRERHGYTYGSYSSLAMNKDAGVFSASAEVRNEVTAPAASEMLAEIKRIRDEPPPENELSMQRQFVAGNFLLSLESPGLTADRVQQIDLYGLPADYFRNYAKRISAVSADAVEGLAKKYLDPDHATIVVVGEAKEVKAPLEKIAPVTMYDLDLNAIK